MTTVIRLLIFLVFISLMPRLGCAQNIAVSSFKLLETDMDANLQGTRVIDQNGETAALIKIVTTEKGFGFSCGALGIVKTVETPGEIWLYVPRGAQKITIKHPQLGVLRDYHFNTTILGGRTYEMILTTGKVETVVKKARTTQYLIFNLKPANAVVELNGEMLQTSEGIATKMVKFGTYEYVIKAPDYLPKKGKVDVNDPNNKKVVDVVLNPNFAKVTLKTDDGAEIWVNGSLKGKGSWEGNLGAGVYEFEARKEGYKPSQITKEISLIPSSQTIILDSPTPIYGDANVNSNPAGAIIYLDGKEIGTTPQIFSEILIGNHKIDIFKEGYEKYSSEITIKEGEEKNINIDLKELAFKGTNQSQPLKESGNYSSINQNLSKAKEYTLSADMFYKIEEYKTAVGYLQKAVNLGYPEAQYKLGYMYQYGQGVKNNYIKAFQLYKKAADQKYRDAFPNIGYMYENGLGVQKNSEKAVEWYLKGADLGDKVCQDNLGLHYEEGNGVAKSYTKALEFYQKSADKGYAKAQYHMGCLYEKGRGVKKDITKAIEWYEKASGNGDDDAEKALIRLGK